MICFTELLNAKSRCIGCDASLASLNRRPHRHRQRGFKVFRAVADDSTYADSKIKQGTAGQDELIVTAFIAETLLPMRTGKYRLRGYKHTTDGGKSWSEPTAIIYGKPENCEAVPVRVHDACFTSEVLGSLKCDCAEQLQLSLLYIKENAPGVVVYLQQEGRGIGLANKIAAYSMQEKGYDTVDANRILGLPDDSREYTSVKNILDNLNIKSISLITNNPRKIRLLSEIGVTVVDRIPCLVQPQEYSANYLDVKGRRMDHMLALDGDFCFYDHNGEKEPTHPPMPIDEL